MTITATATVVDFSVDTPAEFTLIDDLALERGARGWCVQAGVSHGLWVLDKESVAAPNGTTVVATMSNVGRWTGPLAGPGPTFLQAFESHIDTDVVVGAFPATTLATPPVVTTEPTERLNLQLSVAGASADGNPSTLSVTLFRQTNGAPAFPGTPVGPGTGTGATSAGNADAVSCALLRVVDVPPGSHVFNAILFGTGAGFSIPASSPTSVVNAAINILRIGP